MKKDYLIVSEVFYSIQGEGTTTGAPCVFLRLAGCNMLCTWCDTVEVWKKGRMVPFAGVLTEEYVKHLKAGAHLVITGGEPLLHDKSICEWIEWFEKEKGFRPFIEIETNGSILPSLQLILITKKWNVSPKLKNSGEPVFTRINEIALMLIDSQPGSTFKFVIKEEGDILEALQDYGFIDPKKFIFMPCGENREQLDKCRQMVVEECKRLRIRYSDRLHVVIWDKKTGV